jgi:transcriptional regulator with XRE-family HTH domain
MSKIITYSMTTTMSERQIARALSVSRTVVAKTMRAFRACSLEYEGIADMPDSQLLQALECGKVPESSARYQQLAAGFPAMVTELKKKGVTLQWLWELYIQEHPEGYQYSQYCLQARRWKGSRRRNGLPSRPKGMGRSVSGRSRKVWFGLRVVWAVTPVARKLKSIRPRTLSSRG